MKRLLLALSAAALVASALLLPSSPVSSEPVEAFDASVETTSPLSQISPPGNYGVFAVTARFAGPTPATLTITDSVGGGAIDPAVSVFDACNTVSLDGSGVLTCSVALSPGGSATIHVAVRSGLTATQVFNHASVSMASEDTVLGLDIDESNNQDDWSVSVTVGTTTSAFVPQGDSLTYRANGQTHKLTVTEAKGGGGGAIVTMSDPGTMSCGGQACNGVHVEFAQGHDGGFYEAATELDSSGKHDPCRGLGNDVCTGIFWRKLSTDTMVPESPCGFEGPAEPCLQRKYKSDGGKIHYVSELDTDDPDIGLPGIPTVGASS